MLKNRHAIEGKKKMIKLHWNNLTTTIVCQICLIKLQLMRVELVYMWCTYWESY